MKRHQRYAKYLHNNVLYYNLSTLLVTMTNPIKIDSFIDLSIRIDSFVYRRKILRRRTAKAVETVRIQKRRETILSMQN